MRILFVAMFMCCSAGQLIGQFSMCDSLLKNTQSVLFNTNGTVRFRDYAATKWPVLQTHISIRDELESIPIWVNSDSMTIFSDYPDVNIELHFQQKYLNCRSFFQVFDEANPYSAVLENRESSPFGITKHDTIVEYIAQIEVNGVLLPPEAFSDLLNPNRFESYFGIRPIALYKSSCGKYLYLYVFGKLAKGMDIGNQAAFHYSYMAKLILEADGTYIGRMVERGDVLDYFGFSQCPLFIGF